MRKEPSTAVRVSLKPERCGFRSLLPTHSFCDLEQVRLASCFLLLYPCNADYNIPRSTGGVGRINRLERRARSELYFHLQCINVYEHTFTLLAKHKMKHLEGKIQRISLRIHRKLQMTPHVLECEL